MSDRDHDVILPWQFVLWGFMVFTAIGAMMALAFSFDPDLQKQRQMIWAFAGGYLLLFFVATPRLWRSGKRRARQMAANDDDDVPQTSEFGRTVRRSPRQGIILCSITTLVGLLMLLHYFTTTTTTPSAEIEISHRRDHRRNWRDYVLRQTALTSRRRDQLTA